MLMLIISLKLLLTVGRKEREKGRLREGEDSEMDLLLIG